MSVAGRRGAAYGVAVVSALGGLAVTVPSVKPLAGWFFMFQFAAVVGSALFGGLGPGLLTMVLSGVGYLRFFDSALEGSQAYRLGSFVLVSVFFAWLAARMRDAKAAAVEARAAAEASRAAAEAARIRAEAAETEAKVIGARQERLLAVVGHDLRNPLNAITLSAEILQQHAGKSERQASGLSRIVASARRMQALIRDLLDFARARQGAGLPVQPEPARLGDICRAAIDEVRTAQPDGSVYLVVTGDDSAVLDPARVVQVVCNLVTNAFKYGTPGAPVNVSVTDDGAGIRLDVTNLGDPIPQYLVPTLFQPFRPGNATGSVGLGLFIVHEIVRAHGGTVSVRTGEEGSTFTVVFPKGSPQATAPTPVA
jgi:signal transduction histidine kinase